MISESWGQLLNAESSIPYVASLRVTRFKESQPLNAYALMRPTFFPIWISRIESQFMKALVPIVRMPSDISTLCRFAQL